MPKRKPSKKRVLKAKPENSGQWSVRRLLPEFLIVFGFLSIVLYAVNNYNIRQSLRVNQEIINQYQAAEPRAESKRPVHIRIPGLINTSIRQDFYDNGSWTVSDEQASYLAQSAEPGEGGNIILYGHNKKEIFGNLLALKGSEIVTLISKGGEEHQYKIINMVEVDPSDVSYLQPTDEEMLTIYTCSGFMDSKRFIVQAVPVER